MRVQWRALDSSNCHPDKNQYVSQQRVSSSFTDHFPHGEHGRAGPAGRNVPTLVVIWERGSRREEWAGSCRGRQGATAPTTALAALVLQLRITESQGAASVVLLSSRYERPATWLSVEFMQLLPMDPWPASQPFISYIAQFLQFVQKAWCIV